MKIKIKKVYYCESCKKKMFIKKAMENHEKFCLANPANHPACFECKYLSNNRTYDIEGVGDYEENYTETRTFPFYCSKKERPMHNKKSEVLNRSFIDKLGTEIMPDKEGCDDFNAGIREEISDILF